MNASTWLQAEHTCIEHGGHLVSISNTDEMSFIHFLLSVVWQLRDMNIYIGIHIFILCDLIYYLIVSYILTDRIAQGKSN